MSLAEKMMRSRAKYGAINREKIAQMRANQIARITSDFKVDVIKIETSPPKTE